jgi:hypothetical protein
MKGMVALTGLEAMSNGIQFVINEDAGFVKWGKQHLPRLNSIWHFYRGKSGIGRAVQTSFLFYGGLTTLALTFFAIRFNVFDGTAGRTLVGNLAFIGFDQIPGGELLFWAYQLLAVALLAAASMTAFQDAQATEWRDVAIGEIPEFIVYRDPRGTFTRSVTITFGIAVLIMFLVQGETTKAVPFYGVGVLPNHGDGPGDSPAYSTTLRRTETNLGRVRCVAGGRVGGHRVCGPDCGQMERGWLGRVNLVHAVGFGGACPAALAAGFPQSQADSSHRARQSAGAGFHGLNRGVAVVEDAGVSL